MNTNDDHATAADDKSKGKNAAPGSAMPSGGEKKSHGPEEKDSGDERAVLTDINGPARPDRR